MYVPSACCVLHLTLTCRGSSFLSARHDGHSLGLHTWSLDTFKKCLPAATTGIKNKQTKKKHDKECTAVNPTHQIVVRFGLRSRRRRTCDAHSFVPEDAKQSRMVRLEVLPLFYNAKEKKPKRNSLNIFIFTRQNKWISMDLKEWGKYSLQALSDYPQNIGGSLCLRCDK